jgi:hypothetical protein
MTRIQRLTALVAFVVALIIVLLLISIGGAFGPVEFVIAIIIALPITVGIYRLVDRRLLGHR